MSRAGRGTHALSRVLLVEEDEAARLALGRQLKAKGLPIPPEITDAEEGFWRNVSNFLGSGAGGAPVTPSALALPVDPAEGSTHAFRSPRDTAHRWGLTRERVGQLARARLIDGAWQEATGNKRWWIPVDAVRPEHLPPGRRPR